MKQRYLDSADFRIIDEMSHELRLRNDDELSFNARRQRIFELYMEGLQTFEQIRAELARRAEAPLVASDES